MHLLRKYLRLRPQERRLLREAAVLIFGVRLALWLLPFPTVRRFVAKAAAEARRKRAVGETGPLPIGQIAWAVTASSKRLPRANCLTQALAAQVLLAHHGYPAELVIGVRKRAAGLQAHAWVESSGQVVIGGAAIQDHVPIVEFWDAQT